MESADTVQKYSERAQSLAHSQQHKIEKFLEHKCIKYGPEGKMFFCAPIKGYNSTMYRMKKLPSGDFDCSCQYYRKVVKQEGYAICSHIGALLTAFKRHYFSQEGTTI